MPRVRPSQALSDVLYGPHISDRKLAKEIFKSLVADYERISHAFAADRQWPVKGLQEVMQILTKADEMEAEGFKQALIFLCGKIALAGGSNVVERGLANLNLVAAMLEVPPSTPSD